MKVLHLNAGNMYGGIETMLVTLARYRSCCLEMQPVFGACFEGRFADEIRASGAQLQFFPPVRVSRPWTVLQARRAFRNILKESRFDAVISNGSWPHAIFGPEVKAHGLPLIHWIHGLPDRPTWLERWASMTRPDLMICNSNFMAGRALPLFNNPPHEIFRYPVSLTVQPEEEYQAARQESRTDNGVKTNNDVVILQVSRMEAWKGHEGHLQALALLKDMPQWRVWFAGGAQTPQEQQYVNHLQTLAASLGISERVRFLGQRKDVAALLAGADIFCQPNLGPEPFGIVFVEALNARLPVVSMDFGGAAEIVTSDCGRLIPPGNIAQLSKVLSELIGSPRLRSALGSQGPRRARELCDPASQIPKLHGLAAKIRTN